MRQGRQCTENVAYTPEALCRVCSLIFDQPPAPGPWPCCSFQMITLPSYEHDARICPNLGCAQATCHTGPECLQSQVNQVELLRNDDDEPLEDVAGRT